MKKYLAEMIGTMVLVLMGCGTAVSLGIGAAVLFFVHQQAVMQLLVLVQTHAKTECLLWVVWLLRSYLLLYSC